MFALEKQKEEHGRVGHIECLEAEAAVPLAAPMVQSRFLAMTSAAAPLGPDAHGAGNKRAL